MDGVNPKTEVGRTFPRMPLVLWFVDGGTCHSAAFLFIVQSL